MPAKFALRKLMDQVAAAQSLHEVYAGALACLRETLNVERAAVLVADAAGTMRFAAHSGLGAEYRAVVDGHSPWAVGEPNPSTVLVADVAADPALAAYEEALRREAIRALAFVPLRFGSKLLGKFMLYYREPHAFEADEVTIAETVAGHVAFALEHHRVAAALESKIEAERELRRSAELEAALRHANERRLAIALEAGRLGAWEWDIGTGRVEWSPQLEAIHGLPPGSFGGTFQDVRAEVHPADAQRVAAAISAACERPDEAYDVEYRILRADGIPRWVAARGRVLVDERGQASRMLGICSDITERKRAEEASAFLAEASAVLARTLDPQAAVTALAQIVVPRLADWCVVLVTDGVGGVEPVEVVHRDAEKMALAWHIVRRWRTRPEDAAGAYEVLRTGRPSLVPRVDRELLTQRAQDAEHLKTVESLGLHSAVTVPLKARGRVLGTLSLVSAESQRVYGPHDVELAEEMASWAALAIDNAQLYGQAQEARAAAEAARRQIETLATISGELARALDPEDALEMLAQRVVPALADYCVSYAYDGQSITRQGLAHRDPAKRTLVEALCATGLPSLADTAGAGAVIRTGEAILVPNVTPELLARGTLNAGHLEAVRALAPCSAIIAPLKARGRTLGAIALAATTPESGRSYSEADLRVVLELASRAALLIDNARLYAEARTAVKARDDVLAVVSHDLRNPLQSISAAAATLRLPLSEEHRTRSLESIAVASAQMGRLLQDLLDISRMDAGQFSMAAEPVDVAGLVREAFALFRPLADERAVRLECSVAPELPAVDGDRGRISQVLGNLVGNALKYVTVGGLITVTAERRPDAVAITVADTGVGIPAGDLGKVFDRFWRGDSHTGGTGLGLAVAKGIVEAHGGQISVTSRAGLGTVFSFTLRTHVAAPEHAARAAAGASIGELRAS